MKSLNIRSSVIALAVTIASLPSSTLAAATELNQRMQGLFMSTCFEAAKAGDMSIAARAAERKGYKLVGTIYPTGSKRKGYRAYAKARGQEEIWIGATKATLQSCGVTFVDNGEIAKDRPHFLHTISMATKGKPWGKGFVTVHWVNHSFNGVNYEFSVVPGQGRTGLFANFK
ncbi:MAG: hypothetical protein KDE08_10735 [Rhodobacteraceae bacterium]|nr:hypothetical protein [Paracoccaceae bacterium]